MSPAQAHVAGAPADGGAAQRVRSKASAFFDFYRENPRDLDLGFYLFQGVRPTGLTRELDAQLNAQLRAALQPTADAVSEYGLDATACEAEVTALFAHMVGLLVLIHTGRIRMFRQHAPQLLAQYLEQLTERLQRFRKAAALRQQPMKRPCVMVRRCSLALAATFCPCTACPPDRR